MPTTAKISFKVYDNTKFMVIKTVRDWFMKACFEQVLLATITLHSLQIFYTKSTIVTVSVIIRFDSQYLYRTVLCRWHNLQY